MKQILKNLLINLYLFIRRYKRNRYYIRMLLDNKFKNNILTKKQKFDIDKFYKENYGHKIPYTTHDLMTSYTNKFDINYIPTDIFLKFVDTINTNAYHYNVFKDKNFLYNITKLASVKVPKRYFYSINGLFFDSNNDIISKEKFFKQISNIGKVFIKPTIDSGCGKDCTILNIMDNTDIISKRNILDIINNDYKTNFVIQENLVCHKSIANIYSKSVNHFNIVTYIWNNKINTTPSRLTIGTNGNTIDYTPTSECLNIGIHRDGSLYDYAFSSKNFQKIYTHPNTNIVFQNYKIDLFPKVLDTAIKLHSIIPWLKICKWDIILDTQGEPVVIEMEKPETPIFTQLVTAKGIFEDNTREILSFLSK